MSKVFLVDLSHCNGCHACQIVCKDEHCGTDWLPYAAAQPVTGQFWMRLDEKVRGQVPWVRVSHKPVFCAHCADAPCAAVCDVDAFERREDGLLILNPEKCIGCGNCIEACPIGAIFFNDETNIAQKCTGCAHLLDNGWTIPRCADACPHDIIQYKEEEEFGSLLDEAEPLPELAGFGPKVFYLHLPKRFVAGTAVDFVDDEVVIGAKVELSNETAVVAVLVTDDLGDFKFDQVAPENYTVTIVAAGYEPLSVSADLREEDLSLGDLSLEKA